MVGFRLNLIPFTLYPGVLQRNVSRSKVCDILFAERFRGGEPA